MNGTLAVWIPPWYCNVGDQIITICACVDLTKLEHLGSEYLRHSSKIFFRLEPFTVEGEYHSVESCRSRQLLVSLAYTASNHSFFPGLEFFGVFICGADLLVKICLDELKRFPAGLEEDVVKFCDQRVRSQRLERLPRSDCSHINHWGGKFLIYNEGDYNCGKGVVINTVELLRCLISKGRPHLFLICSNSNVCRLNLEADRVDLVLQVGSVLQVETKHIVQRDGEFLPERLLALAQPNY